jgi:hypothetical protein
MKGKIIFIAGVLSLIPFLPALAVDASAETGLIWWRFLGQERLKDGGVQASFALMETENAGIEKLELFYTAKPASPYRLDGNGEEEKAVYYKAVPKDTREISIYSGRYEQVELWALARTASGVMSAQTLISLYGESKQSNTDFERIDSLPDLPGLDLNRERRFFTAMTGESLSFGAMNPSPDPVLVFLNGKQNAELFPIDGIYRYRFPEGPRLSSGGLAAYSDVVFVAKSSEGGGFSCYVPLFRSLKSNLDMRGGITVLLAAAALSLALVLLKGRRFA